MGLGKYKTVLERNEATSKGNLYGAIEDSEKLLNKIKEALDNEDKEVIESILFEHNTQTSLSNYLLTTMVVYYRSQIAYKEFINILDK